MLEIIVIILATLGLLRIFSGYTFLGLAWAMLIIAVALSLVRLIKNVIGRFF